MLKNRKMKWKLTFIQKKGPHTLNGEQKFPLYVPKACQIQTPSVWTGLQARAAEQTCPEPLLVAAEQKQEYCHEQFQPGGNGRAFSYLFIGWLMAIWTCSDLRLDRNLGYPTSISTTFSFVETSHKNQDCKPLHGSRSQGGSTAVALVNLITRVPLRAAPPCVTTDDKIQ